jgi:phosphoribosylformylglycinamidine (FGAM) synthase PurS component
VKIEALVKRKTQDLVRTAAEDLLLEKYPEVRRVDRAELWTFEIDGPSAASDAKRILDESTLIVNPNVHRYTLEEWRRPPAEGTRLCVRVTDRVDARASSVLRAARERRGITGVREVRRAVVWFLDLETKDAAAAGRIGEQIAGPEGGILANVHAQDVEMEVMTSS